MTHSTTSISNSGTAQNSQTVLIVEDDDSLREALCDSLGDDGYQVLSAASGSAALAAVQNNTVALVISDVQMSPMSGTTLLRKIKRAQPELPVVLMTAYGTIQKAVDAMRDGAVHYLVKPFAADTLVETVRQFLPVDHAEESVGGLIAEDPLALECVAMAKRVASSDATVML
ncbi:MAG: sigma-54-dependent transcriptional regulator, partial [Gammaproteobacteria bacterium]